MADPPRDKSHPDLQRELAELLRNPSPDSYTRPVELLQAAERPNGLLASLRLDRRDENALRNRAFPPPVIGDYQILDWLGAGAMGTVYRGKHKTSGKYHAIKVLDDADESLARRFRREIQTLRRLNHPYIVGCHTSDWHAGHPFFAMDLVSGNPRPCGHI